MRRHARTVLALVVGVALLALALRGIDLRGVGTRIGEADRRWLAVAAAVYLLAYFVRSLRWRLILRPVVRVGVRESFFMLMAGYFLNYIIPIRAGELAKSFFLKRTRGLPIATTLPTVFVDKLLELFSILLVIVLFPVLSVQASGELTTIIVSVLVIFVAAVGLLLLAIRNRERAVDLVCRGFRWLPARLYERLSEWLALFINGLSLSASTVRSLWMLLFLTGTAVALDAVYFRIMFLAFDIPVRFPIVLFGYTLISLSYILPTPPAQVGYNEFIMKIIFSVGLGLPLDDVMAVMLLAHPLTGVLITVVGIWSFSAMGIRVGESFRGIEAESNRPKASGAACPPGGGRRGDREEEP